MMTMIKSIAIVIGFCVAAFGAAAAPKTEICDAHAKICVATCDQDKPDHGQMCQGRCSSQEQSCLIQKKTPARRT
jgi:hypothetical protein